MEQKIINGTLSYIAKSDSKGIKLKEYPTIWYNPVDEKAKNSISEDYVGKEIMIYMSDKPNKFTEMVLQNADEEEIPEETIPVKEEKVSPAPLQKEEKVEISTEKDADLRVDPVLNEGFDFLFARNKVPKDYFTKLNGVKVETETKGPMNLKYASWAEVWQKLKSVYPSANYLVHEDSNGMPYFYQPERGAFVKVSVKVNGLVHTVHLPVMNHSNKAAKGTELDVVLINKNIQRAFAKAIAMHGIGLYVYKGEDFPEDK